MYLPKQLTFCHQLLPYAVHSHKPVLIFETQITFLMNPQRYLSLHDSTKKQVLIGLYEQI